MESGIIPTEVLKEEHRRVLEKLEAMEGLFKHLDQKESIAPKLTELTSFFKTDFWVHFDKEERALFPEFDNFMPRGAGPLAVMLEEHEVLRNTNEVMQEAIARYLGPADSAETRRTIVESGTHFIEFLRSHINKEDHILFSMADMHLNQSQNARILKLFAEMEKPTSVSS
jgi:hemerythrin-like domain-containing protein